MPEYRKDCIHATALLIFTISKKLKVFIEYVYLSAKFLDIYWHLIDYTYDLTRGQSKTHPLSIIHNWSKDKTHIHIQKINIFSKNFNRPRSKFPIRLILFFMFWRKLQISMILVAKRIIVLQTIIYHFCKVGHIQYDSITLATTFLNRI